MHALSENVKSYNDLKVVLKYRKQKKCIAVLSATQANDILFLMNI